MPSYAKKSRRRSQKSPKTRNFACIACVHRQNLLTKKAKIFISPSASLTSSLFRHTEKVSFSAFHRVYQPHLDERTNESWYGACANPNGHGHNFVLHVTVQGRLSEGESDFCRETLSLLLHKYASNTLEGANLNQLLSKVPTCEHLIVALWQTLSAEIEKCLGKANLCRLVLYETARNFVEYAGDGQR